MSASSWLIIAIILFSLSFVLLVAAVFMFLKFKIPTLIDDLSGRRVAREVREMRERSVNNGVRTARPSKDSGIDSVKDLQKALAHASRSLSPTVTADLSEKTGNTADFPSDSGEKTAVLFAEDDNSTDILYTEDGTAVLSGINDTEVLSGANNTEILSNADETEILSNPNSTAVLSGENRTEILSEAAETAILSDMSGTAVLLDDKDGTDVLSGSEIADRRGTSVSFTIVRSIVVIHTDERIG